MNRLLAACTILTVSCVCTHAYAEKNTTPKPTTGQCSCKCSGGGTYKQFEWTGSEAGCTGFNGGLCTSSTPSGEETGVLSGCNMVVEGGKPSPKSVEPGQVDKPLSNPTTPAKPQGSQPPITAPKSN